MAKLRRNQHPETMRRNVAITSVAPRISFRVRGEQSGEPEFVGHQGLELRGLLTEPLKDVQDVVIRVG